MSSSGIAFRIAGVAAAAAVVRSVAGRFARRAEAQAEVEADDAVVDQTVPSSPTAHLQRPSEPEESPWRKEPVP
jgi:hypothetical protein